MAARARRTSRKPTEGFSEQERAAMRERAAELRKETRRRGGDKAAAAELDVLSKIAEMPAPDRAVAERIHAIVTDAAPELSPKLWYSTFGFSPEAGLDDDSGLWSTSYAVTELRDEAEQVIAQLVRKAVS